MKVIINQLVIVLMVIGGMTFTSANAALLEDENAIWKSGYQYVKFAPINSDGYGKNDHPVELDRSAVAAVLKALEFRSDDFFATDDDLEPVFSVAQAQRLGDVLSSALRKAKPEQDLIFAIEKSVSKLIFLQDQALTSGRAFYKDGKLNIIIGDYERTRNKEFERVYDSSGQLSPYNLAHGSRSSSLGNVKQSLVNMAGVSNKVVDNEPRQDWFVIDIQKAYAAVQQQRQAEQGSDGANAEATREMRLEAARMKKQQRELKLEMARMREQMKSNDGGGSSGGETPEERLKTLDKLLEQGLISKEEYQSKREQILKDL